MRRLEKEITLENDELDSIEDNSPIIYGKGLSIIEVIKVYLSVAAGLFVPYLMFYFVIATTSSLFIGLSTVTSGLASPSFPVLTISFLLASIIVPFLHLFILYRIYPRYSSIFIVSDKKIFILKARNRDYLDNPKYYLDYESDLKNIDNVKFNRQNILLSDNSEDVTIDLPKEEIPIDVQNKLYNLRD